MSLTLDNLRKSAKRWLKALRAGDQAAIERFRKAHPSAPAEPALRDVQHALALERGCSGWLELKAKADAPPPEDGLIALLAAAERGDADSVAAILDREPALLDRRGLLPGHAGLRTALHFGVLHEAVVRELLSRGADPNVRDEGDDAYPLHFAAENGRLAIVRMLVEHGGDPYGPGTYHLLDAPGWATCFEWAYHPEVARFLIASGAPLTFFPAVALGETSALSRLLGEGVDLDQRMDKTNQRRTALHLAVVKKQPGVLAALLELGADPNLEDAAGLTPLDQAALGGELEMAERLLAAGAALKLPSAILLDRSEDLERILDADPLRLHDNRLWARMLVQASRRASGALVAKLLAVAKRHRAGLTIVNMEDDTETAPDGAAGFTPLHAAAGAGNREAVAVLLQNGADPRRRDGQYFATPAGWARHFGHAAVVDQILAAEVDLFDAIDADRADVVTRILGRDPEAIERPFGAYAKCPVRDGAWWPAPDTLPLQWALSQGHANAGRVLVERGAASRTSRDLERARRAAAFLQAACWDHHVSGRREHHLQEKAAQRLLAADPGLAEASLFTAIVCGNLPAVERFLDARPEAARERGGGRDWTPLLTLCYTRFDHPPTRENAVAIARLLLDNGADPNDFYMAMDASYTALVGVAGEGEQDAPRQPYAEALYDLLLARGAEPFDIQVLYNTHFSGRMQWWLELSYRHTEATPRGAAWRDKDWKMLDMGVYGNGARFVLETALKKRDLALAEWALAHGADPEAAPARDWRFPKTSLYQEARRLGFDAMAELLLRYGASPALPPFSDRQQLMAASLRLDRAALEEIFARDPALRSSPDAMLAAAEQGRADVIELLLDLGVSPEVRDLHDERPLHRVAMSGSLEAARLLVERGAEIDPRDLRFGGSPLGWASHFYRPELMRFLSGISRDFRNVCLAGNLERVRQLLAEDPALATRPEADGNSPLFWLAEDEAAALAIAEALLASGADPARRNGEGKSAADVARERGFAAVADRIGRALAARLAD